MILKQSFSDFLSTGKAGISLDDTRSKKIQTAHNAVRGYLQSLDEIKGIYYETFLQGSYRLNTAVRPQGNGEYDVDVMLSLSLADQYGYLPDSKEVIKWLVELLEMNGVYKGKTEQKKRCARINYVDGFHMDVVPAHCNGNTEDPLQVPTDWDYSHPKGFRAWCIYWHDKSNKNFYGVVKMLKWWRNLRYGDAGSPKSILLTTLVGHYISATDRSIDTALVETMESINNWLKNQPSVPWVGNPSLPKENLARTWSQHDYEEFKESFDIATKKARLALNEKDEEKTIEIWNSKILFDGTFPKTVRGLGENEKRMNEAMKSKALYMGSAGIIGTTKSSISVPATKFYGS